MSKRTQLRRWNPERLRQAVESSGFTRKFIAKRCELEPESLSHILAGRKPGRMTLKVLADALRTNADFLDWKTNDARPREMSVA